MSLLRRRMPILGKHKKRILCGAWSIEGLLALASEDKMLTINTSDGDTRREITLQGDPSDLQFSEMKMDHRIGGENTVQPVTLLWPMRLLSYIPCPPPLFLYSSSFLL